MACRLGSYSGVASLQCSDARWGTSNWSLRHNQGTAECKQHSEALGLPSSKPIAHVLGVRHFELCAWRVPSCESRDHAKVFACLIGGVLPFAGVSRLHVGQYNDGSHSFHIPAQLAGLHFLADQVFTELFFIMSSIWQHQSRP